jgi:hypothetical protein
MAAKFMGEPNKVVTGSHDRTLKIYDLRARACECIRAVWYIILVIYLTREDSLMRVGSANV